MSISFDFFSGVHRDPRVISDDIVYGRGSFVTDSLPTDIEFVYFVITNTSTNNIVLADFFLETGHSITPYVIWDLDLPNEHVHNRLITPSARVVIGFLRDLFTRRVLRCAAVQEPFIFNIACRLADGAICRSDKYELSTKYPANPLQDIDISRYRHFFDRRISIFDKELSRINEQYGTLSNYANLHLTLGLHKFKGEGCTSLWQWREWMPAATNLWLVGSFTNFKIDDKFAFTKDIETGIWQLDLPENALKHGDYVELRAESPSTNGEQVRRIPAFSKWVEQDKNVEEQWCARVWSPDDVYRFKNDKKAKWTDFPRIYEAHIGIAQPYIGRTDKSVGTFEMFSKLLPRIKESGYTAVQLMGVLEHLLYKSFGYQVSSYFATSSRFGSPDDFKRLVDEAHRLGLSVILDIPHSHSVPNTEQGIARYDTTSFLFADKANQWGTISFDFCKEMTRRFLLSNCRYWMEEYHIDGFRFDAVGNMIYLDNGINDSFSDVNSCFYSSNGSSRIDEAGVLYLELANELIHSMGGVSIAEEFSGMPGMTSRACEGGLAFDYRLAMGIPDFWGKFIKKGRTSSDIWYEMTNRRGYERTISYVACHDQSINGHDAMIWRLIGDDMYEYMSHLQTSWKASRGIALYKMMRLVTLGTADAGYLSFMGDEFGHPEWIDADGYGHRQWHLTARNDIKYGNLWAFDKASLVDLLAKHADSFREKPYMRYVHDEYRILAFERGRLLFVFNFNETEAVENLSLWVTPGKYVEMLSSDSKLFAGNGNLEISNPQMEHFSQTDDSNSDKSVERISLYLPPLVVLVMLRS